MFENLSERLNRTIRNLRGIGRISESNVEETLSDIRIALLEADAALPVVTEFTDKIREKALGQEVMKSLTPGQTLVKIVNDELIYVLGEANAPLNLESTPPIVILMAGLQGSGKTTTTAKIARYLKEQHKKNVMVVSTDIYRPAAMDQLKVLAQEINVQFYPGQASEKPEQIALKAYAEAKKQYMDVLIIDTAGRLHIDEAMMHEIKMLHQATKPIETLFVVDSMTGQDAANTAKAFNDALPLTGVVLTKIDGDARGGAALSVKMLTGKPIKFIGTGEKSTGIEVFHPDRIASRILGMGDIVSLVEEVEQKIDKEKAEKLAKKIKSNKRFDLEDFKEQLQQMNKMGGIMSMLTKIPGLNQVPQALKNQVDDKAFNRIVAIINSMTQKERKRPEIINGSRKRRIASGSGTQTQDVNKLLKQFEQMQKMMKKFSKPGKMMRMLSQMQGRGGFPPDMF